MTVEYQIEIFFGKSTSWLCMLLLISYKVFNKRQCISYKIRAFSYFPVKLRKLYTIQPIWLSLITHCIWKVILSYF